MKWFLASLFVAFLTGCEIYPECSSIHGYIDEVCEPSDNLSLDSKGGLLSVAIEIANMTKYTHIEGDCSSACVVIASRGEDRSMCHDSWIGLHQGNTTGATKLMLEFFYQDDRIDFGEIERRVNETPHNSMHFIPADTAKRLGLVDTVLYCT